jgi:hypothetical protein
LIVNGSANMQVARQWLSERHVTAATFTYATIKLSEAVFSVRSVPQLVSVSSGGQLVSSARKVSSQRLA